MRRALRLLCAAMTLIGAIGVVSGGIRVLFRSVPAFADGAVPCASNTTPADPGEGFCANYNGEVTWYGTYGSKTAPLPSTDGFGLCADPAASGGDFPEPSYDYVVGAAPAGAVGDWNALGFAFSEGAADGWWGGSPGHFTGAQAAVAAKLFYDHVAWGSAIPALDPGVGAALAELENWFNEAGGTTDASPQISLGLTNGGATFTGSATVQVHVQFAGSDGPVVGQELTLSATNGTFNSPSGSPSVGVSTDANGNVDIEIFASGTATVGVTAATPASAPIGQPGIDFYRPSRGNFAAQTLAGFVAPTALSVNGSFSPTSTPATPVAPVAPVTQTGTVSVLKSGDDEAYYSVGGAVFQVLDGSVVRATLTTNNSGTTDPSGPLPIGTYTVHESRAPAGYSVEPDQPVTVTADQNSVVAFTGSNRDRIIPSTLTIHKVSSQGGAPLAGAVFSVKYSSDDNSTFDQRLGTCTTDATGTCSPGGNDGTVGLLPGNYQVQELQAPSGYNLDPTTDLQTVSLAAGESGSVVFSDSVLGSLRLQKSGNDTDYDSITGAVFNVSGPQPGNGIVGYLTVGPDGTSNTISGMVPGTYTVTEWTPPTGYQDISPVTVAVLPGAATTTLDVLDQIVPATLTILKQDRQSQAPLAGASFKVTYDEFNSGTYTVAIGECTTGSNGECSPPGNDGPNDVYPGNYQVTELVPPPGYALNPATATQDVTITPAEIGIVRFADGQLVSAAFQKVATGNINAAQLTLAGVVVNVHQGTSAGPIVTSCTTVESGACATAATLDSGSTYCWAEVAAPAGLSGGANGCFTATNTQASEPIVVGDAGEFVSVAVQKVDAADPGTTLPGAVFDLYRKDGGHGPGIVPNAPNSAAPEAAETWVARATTGNDGTATFPLQFPGYAYCTVEHTAPAGYQAATGQQCTGVLSGATATPAPVTTITVADASGKAGTVGMATVQAHKYNVLTPNTGIPGATYDLYAEGDATPAGSTATSPADVSKEPGDTWYARGTTDESGNLSFSVPSGYAWCLLEHSAPANYIPDPALHCSGTITTSSPAAATTVALPETRSTVYVSARKFNSLQPDTVIAGATYELLVQGPMPSGYGSANGAATVPDGADVPNGDTYWGQGTSNAQGLLTFAVPAGFAWCLHELAAPAGYETDPSFHCTSVLTNETPASAASIALPETAGPGGNLAFTGGPPLWLPISGILLVAGGAGLLVIRRRKRDANSPA